MKRIGGVRVRIFAPEEAEKLLASFEKQLILKFEAIREEIIPPNTKGGEYEEIVKKFFEDYIGDAFEFLTRFGVLDIELKVNSIYKTGENEFDVVAIYRDAVPKLRHHRLVPYDAVAFIIEVKQNLRLSFLKKDLMKLRKLNELKVHPIDSTDMRILERKVKSEALKN